ncbi:MAG: sarcosine oxidase subunit beta, partial [Alphaproteobacteria bacterium]|nr:sarcosine oxidase subunit beta [Alphaproteobacteria bacterium]
MAGFSAYSLLRQALTGHKHWPPQWPDAQPKAEYDVVVVGAGGHGL